MDPLTLDMVPSPPEGMHRVYGPLSGKWEQTLYAGDSRLAELQRLGWIIW